MIEPAVEDLLNINKAVQHDIEDSIIMEGMIPKKGRHTEERKNAADIIKDMKTIHNAEVS